MNMNHTCIACIMDRSGSMMPTRNDVIGGYNSFIQEQQKLPGTADITLILFDNEYQVVYDATPLADTPVLSGTVYFPRGSTALLDAIGRTINVLIARIAAMPEADKPGKVIVTIITDGHENASHEFTHAQVRQLITQQQVLGWEFLYFGANQDAFTVGGGMGIHAANNSSYAATGTGTRSAYVVMSQSVSAMRTNTLEPAFVDGSATNYVVPNAIKGKKP